MHGTPLIPWLMRKLSKSMLQHSLPRSWTIWTGFRHLESHMSSNTCTDLRPDGLFWVALLSSSGFEQVSMMVWALIFISNPFASQVHGPTVSMAIFLKGAMDSFLGGTCPTLQEFLCLWQALQVLQKALALSFNPGECEKWDVAQSDLSAPACPRV